MTVVIMLTFCNFSIKEVFRLINFSCTFNICMDTSEFDHSLVVVICPLSPLEFLYLLIAADF